MIYLDNAATSLIKPPQVERAVLKALRTMASPGRGAHRPAELAAETVYRCRETAAGLFGLPDPADVVFTMNATHALNIAINSLTRPGMRVLTSGFEHNSVTRPLRAAGAEIVIAGRSLFDPGAVLRDFERNIDRAELVVCTHVSNVFGFVLPVYDIAELCRDRGVPLIVDASQSAGVLEINAKKLGAAFIAMPGHKGLFGPQGTGLLLCGAEAKPLMHGGSGSDSILQAMPDYLPDRLEAGTHNVCGIAGLLAGMEFVVSRGTESIFEHEKAMLELMRRELEPCPELELFADSSCQSGVLSFRSGQVNSEELAGRLGKRGVCVRAGLHCAPFAHESAGTLGSGTVRLSFSPFTSKPQLLTAAAIIKQCIREP